MRLFMQCCQAGITMKDRVLLVPVHVIVQITAPPEAQNRGVVQINAVRVRRCFPLLRLVSLLWQLTK
jgi:hypothetical protein